MEETIVAVNLVGATADRTGVQRYATELWPRLLSHEPKDFRLVLATDDPDEFERLGVDMTRVLSLPRLGRRGLLKHAVMQSILPLRLHVGGVRWLISPMNAGPILFRRQIVVVHDTSWRLFPKAFTWRFRFLNYLLTAGFRIRQFTIVGVSASAAESLQVLYPERTIHTILSGPGMTKDPSSGPATSSPQVRKRILWIGSHQLRKDLATAVAAVEGFAQKHPEDQFELVVAGGLARTFRPLDSIQSSAVRVVYVEAPSDVTVELLYATSQMLLFTSLHEGFGFPPAEALQRGLPVVTSDLPSLREMGLRGARFCKPGDVASFQAGLEDVFTHPPDEMGHELSWDDCADRWWTLVTTLHREERHSRHWFWPCHAAAQARSRFWERP